MWNVKTVVLIIEYILTKTGGSDRKLRQSERSICLLTLHRTLSKVKVPLLVDPIPYSDSLSTVLGRGREGAIAADPLPCTPSGHLEFRHSRKQSTILRRRRKATANRASGRLASLVCTGLKIFPVSAQR